MTQRIVPMIAYEDAAAAIDWLSAAFGFTERVESRVTGDDGVVGHAELELDGEVVMLATPNREYQSPAAHRQTCEAAARWMDDPWVIDGLFVRVDDVDTHHARAVAAGARVIRPLESSAYTAMLCTAPRTSRDIAGCSDSSFDAGGRRRRRR